MAVDGWVKIHRILSLDQIWTAEPFTRGQAWVDLILLANHVPGAIRARGVYINIDRGQVGWSEVKLAERWRWSRDKVRRWLSELEKKEHKIIQQKNNVTSLITIIKYDLYQSSDTANDTANDTAEKQQKNSRQDTNKNVKNVKNVKNKTYTSDFISFWDCYPKKVAKDAAWKSWQKRNGERPDIAVLISAVENQKKSEQWAKDGGQFIPHPASWLNQGRWDDEAPAQENNSALDRNDPVFKSWYYGDKKDEHQ
ncbi:MAG TPA: hypothetical protein VJZ49_15465 [Syntrophales bacterium]|nr:hypothetical protein [Syntrophales bacterium]